MVTGAVLLGTVAFARLASAEPNDLSLGRLSWYPNADMTAAPAVRSPGCGTSSTGYAQCFSDNDAFVNLMNEMGGVLAPSLLAPAATIGYNHLYVAYEASVTNVNGQPADARFDYWRRGTEGGSDVGGMRVRTPGAMLVSRLHVRKGFPMGFELGLQGSYLHESSLVALGLDIRWAPFEGFRRSWGQYVPDLAFRGAVNTLAANSQAYLTVVTVDASISKPITLGGSAVLTPYLGGLGMLIFGDSSVVDATPLRSSYGECARRVTVFYTEPDGRPASRLECQAGAGTPMGASNDSQNELVFTAARILRWRGFVGARFRYSIFTLTAEFGFDLSDPGWLSEPALGSGVPQTRGEMPRRPELANFHQYTGSLGVGVTF